MQQQLSNGKVPFFKRTNGEVKYGLLLAAAIFFILVVMLPTPKSMVDLVSQENPLGYQLDPGTKTITETVNKILKADLTPEHVAFKSKVMVAILFTSAFLWGTEAIPLGATDLLIGSLLYLFFILPLDSISKAYMTDAVFFIFGVLSIALGVSKTGLDRRIGILLLGGVKSLKYFCFIFFPILAIFAGFFSAHALTAILVPVLMSMYRMLCDHYGIEEDKPLAVLLLLGTCFAINQGGTGSPAAGGRNAIMVGYLKEYGKPISFGEWMFYGLPFVIIISLVVGAYMYFVFRRKIKVPELNFSQFIKQEKAQLPKMTKHEKLMTGILLMVIALWLFGSKQFGLGGPSIFGTVLMLVFNIVSWKEVQTKVKFEVVGLYAAACAMGVGLKMTGASLWMAKAMIDALPPALVKGDSLIVAIGTFTGVLTNFMSDGATVAAVGPVALSLGKLANIHIWKVGLACSFASSFANVLIVGTPNNALTYVAAIDPKTDEKVLTLKDFLVHGIPITILALLTLFFGCVWGYWRFMPWN